MSGNTAGVEKVEEADGMYAFFMESAAIDYLVERRCKLSQVGGLLDSKGYGIATRRGTPYKEYLDNAILKLMEGGVLHKLKIKWWKQKRGGGACDAKDSGGGVKPLGLSNVAGVFLVTMIGCVIAFIFAIMEFLYGTRQSAIDKDIPWLEEIADDFKFVMLCYGNTYTKDVKSRSVSSSSKSPTLHSSHLSSSDDDDCSVPVMPPPPAYPPLPDTPDTQIIGEEADTRSSGQTQYLDLPLPAGYRHNNITPVSHYQTFTSENFYEH